MEVGEVDKAENSVGVDELTASKCYVPTNGLDENELGENGTAGD